MISMIQFEKCGMTINYPIAKIDCIALDAMKEEVLIGVTGMEETQIVSFECVEDAEAFYQECLKKVDFFYRVDATCCLSQFPTYAAK